MWIRKLVLIATLVIASAPTAARAEVGIGAFFGEPTGIDFKLDMSHRSSLDLLVGYYSHWRDYALHGGYAHATYLVTPLVGPGDSVNLPLRLGFGVAVFDDDRFFNDGLSAAVRLPFEVALRFRSVPLEIYFELALKLTFVGPARDPDPLDLDGGIGLRFYL